MEKLQISVIMSVYKNDSPVFFEQAITSVLNQTYPASEIVLVRDGLVPDDLQAIIDVFVKNPKVSYFPLEQNIGLGRVLRFASERATHPLLARMDSDDISCSGRFEKQVVFFEDSSISVVGGQIKEFIEHEDYVEFTGKRVVPTTSKNIKKSLKFRSPMNHVTVMIRKKHLLESGNYEDCLFHEDYNLWSNMLSKGFRLINVNETLVNVRVDKKLYQRRGGLKYFKAAVRMQKNLLNRKQINVFEYTFNLLIRFVIQVLFPSYFRKVFFNNVARKKTV